MLLISGSWRPNTDDGYGNIIERKSGNRMNYLVDYNNIDHFHNRQNVDKFRNGKSTGKTYRSFVNRSSSFDEGIQPGIPNGRTAFYATGSEGRGDLVYPENHYFFTPDYHMLHDLAYTGTQTSSSRTLVDPGGTNTDPIDDDRKPWYSVKVPDENVIQLKNLRDKS